MWFNKSSYSGHQKKRHKKTVFGGAVKSHKEIQHLHKTIKQKEEEEFASFEKEFQEKANDIWGGPHTTKDDSQKVKKEYKPLTAKEKLMILSRLQLNLKKMMNEQKQKN